MYKLFGNVFKHSSPARKEVCLGRSMIEMLGVLAIVGVLSVSGIAGYSKAMTKFKVNKTIQQMAYIVSNIRTIFANERTYDGLEYSGDIDKAQRLLDLGIITAEMFTNQAINGNDDMWTNMINPFNGGIWINVNTPGEIEKKFVISYGGLNSEVCRELAVKDWTGLGVHNLGINGNDGDTIGWADDCDNNSDDTIDDGVNDIILIACPKGKNVPIPVPPLLAAKACSVCQYYKYGCNILLGFSD